MDLYISVFYVFACVTLLAACVVVFSKNIVHAAFALLFAFFGVAGIYVFLLADFLAITQLLVYVGGITVLILFGVMLTNKQINVDIKEKTLQFIPAVVLCSALAGTLIGIDWMTDWHVIPAYGQAPAEATAPRIGELLLTQYLLPFEIASILLLVALVGAAMIARREKNV
jgi:NADH-quinone oxidoreductase subunit J